MSDRLLATFEQEFRRRAEVRVEPARRDRRQAERETYVRLKRFKGYNPGLNTLNTCNCLP